MTYPASPNDAGAYRVRPDSGRFWAGGAATAVVAALIALVGILISRWLFNIPILAPAGDGAWGNAHTGEYALVAAVVALVAAGLLYLLVLGTPQPGRFFDWIMGLATLAAVVYPFSTSAPLDQKAATAVVNLVLGIAITTLLTGVAARAVRRPVVAVREMPPGYRHPAYQDPSYLDPGRRDAAGPGYPVRDEGYVRGSGDYEDYPPADEDYLPGQRRGEPTRPINVPRDGRNWQ
jgi:hypothetical protein